jgi:16S rRNA (guanine1207-N2)-methyltransferase
MADKGPDVDVTLLDVDAVALEAARENVPGGHFLLRDGLPGPEDGIYDLVVSNPPFHRGKAADPSMLIQFIEGASRVVASRGSVLFVAQARISLRPELDRCFRRVAEKAQTGTFRVWKASGPL